MEKGELPSIKESLEIIEKKYKAIKELSKENKLSFNYRSLRRKFRFYIVKNEEVLEYYEINALKSIKKRSIYAGGTVLALSGISMVKLQSSNFYLKKSYFQKTLMKSALFLMPLSLLFYYIDSINEQIFLHLEGKYIDKYYESLMKDDS